MCLSAVIEKIFLSEISTSANTAAAWNIAREGAFIVFFTHVFCVCGLRVERFVF